MGFMMWGLVPCAQALPIEPKRLASELKLNGETIRVKLSNLGRILSIRGTGLALSLAKNPGIGNIQAENWVIDCKQSTIFEPTTGRSRQIPRSGVLIESV